MCAVGRQDQERLDQREGQRCDHDQRYLPGELHLRTGEHHPRGKRQHGRDDSEYHRLGHHLDAHNRGGKPFLSALHPVVDVLPDNDGIIDDDPDHDEEGEQRQEVECHADQRQQHERAGKGRGDTDRDPEGDDRAQEQHQHDQDQHQPIMAELPMTLSCELNWSAPSHHSEIVTVSGSSRCLRSI